MGYDLHITRAPDWTEAATYPISEVQWTELAQTEPTLQTFGTYSERDLTTGTTVDRPIYRAGTADAPSLLWSHGEIIVTGATESDVQQMKVLADRLSAWLIGDDGETY